MTARVAVDRRLMTYRVLTMIDVREILRRWADGQSARAIAGDTGIDRKTVRRYVETAEALPLAKDHVATDAEVAEVVQRVQSRPLGQASDERTAVARHRTEIEGWLGGKPPLRLTRIHALLVTKYGLEVSYATVRRFVQAELGWGKPRVTVRLDDTAPGEVAQIDFGKMGMMRDPATGALRTLWALIVTLVYSRYQFVWPCFFQTTEEVCEALDAAWTFFDGVTKVILPDNMSSVVHIADPLSPTIVEAFAEYAQARGFFIDAARVRSPKDKARVENQVPYVRESCFAGETFNTLDEARDRARTWCRDVAGARIHGSTRRVPREVFVEEEQPLLRPPPTERFDVPVWAEAKVHPDHHIQVAKGLYSVPTRFVGKTVRVRRDHASVRIYLGSEMIKMHPRVAPGKRSTDVADYPTGKGEIATRDVESLLRRARLRGVHVGRYAERVLACPLPWTRMRLGYALLRLCDKYGDGRVEAVCQSALAFDVVDVVRVTRMLKSAVTPAAPNPDSNKIVPLVPPRFARPTEHFVTLVPGTTKGGQP